MTGLQTMLEEASSAPSESEASVDIAGDLHRGHRALRRRRTRLAAGAVGGFAILGVVGASALARPAGQATHGVTEPGTVLLHTPRYDVPPAPPGWHLVGGDDFAVVYRKDGDTNTYLDRDFEQAIVVYLEDETGSLDYGTPTQYDGRTFYHWSTGGPDTESMAVRQSKGEWLRLQYPTSAGLDTSQMIAFLDAVVVKAGAQGTKG